MSFSLYIADIIINFFSWIQISYDNFYKNLKYKSFSKKLLYYAIYDNNTKRYTLIHNYDNFLSTLYFYFSNYVFKINYTGITYNDLELILHSDSTIIIASYILNNKEYHDIFDYEVYTSPKITNHNKIVYAYAETINYKDDLTHEYELFKNSILKLKLPAQDIYNILMGYKNKRTEKITNIKIMSDDTFEEKTYI